MSDLILPDTHSWNVEKVTRLFSPRDRNAILNIPLSLLSTEDKIIWHWSSNGIYSIKTGYRVLTEKIEENSHLFAEGNWARIWKANVPHKVRQFLWSAARDTLPTRVNLQAKGIQVPCTCLLCGRNPETSWHVFIDCPTSAEVWREAGLWEEIDRHAEMTNSFSELLFVILRESPNAISENIIMIAWSLWYRRNDVCWSNGPKDPGTVIRRAKNVHTDWSKLEDLRNRLESTNSLVCDNLWHYPPVGFLKCNTDAAIFLSEAKAGIGIVFRNDQGMLINARSIPFEGMPDVRECEAMALLQGMTLAVDSGFQRVLFETDARVVVDAIHTLDDDISEFGDIIGRTRSILRDQEFFSVRAIRRQANGVAHGLAQLSRSLSCLVTLSDLPSSLSRCMNNVCSSRAH